MHVIYSFELCCQVDKAVVWMSVQPNAWGDWDQSVSRISRVSDVGCRVVRDAGLDVVFNVTSEQRDGKPWALTYDTCTEGSNLLRHERFEVHGYEGGVTTLFFICGVDGAASCCMPPNLRVLRGHLKDKQKALSTYFSD